MRGLKRMLTAALFLFLALSLQVTANARDGAGYTYTVRLFSGQQGRFENVRVSVVRGGTVIPLQFGAGEMVSIEGLMYGDRLTFDVSTADMELSQDGKYYVKGIRESGKDNQTIQSGKGRSVSVGASASFLVEQDMDYVVGYGLLVDAVAYTVNYQDAQGNTLAPSRTYYGNVGDKPVVAYLYIEGYQPQAYNITGTLQADASKNVFTFIYTPGEPGRVITETIVLPGTVIDLGTEVIQGGGGGGGTRGTGDSDGTDASDPEGAEDGIGEDGSEESGTSGLPDEGPVEMEDLDDQDTPLGNFRGGVDKVVEVLGDGFMMIGNLPMRFRAVMLVGSAGLLGIGVLGILKIGRKKKEERNFRDDEEKKAKVEDGR